MGALKPSLNHKLPDTLTLSNTPDDDNEYARYLASYLWDNLDYDSRYNIDQESIYKLIKEFNDKRI